MTSVCFWEDGTWCYTGTVETNAPEKGLPVETFDVRAGLCDSFIQDVVDASCHLLQRKTTV